jgi:hypothetical protein
MKGIERRGGIRKKGKEKRDGNTIRFSPTPPV